MYYLCTYRDNCQILCTYRLEKIVVNGDYPQLVECLVGVTSCYKQQTSASEKQGVTVRKCGAPGENDHDKVAIRDISIQSSPILVGRPTQLIYISDIYLLSWRWGPPIGGV